jgi:hypothetical protein
VGDEKATRQSPCDGSQQDGVLLEQFYIRNVKVRILQSADIRHVRLIQQRGKFAEDRAGLIHASEDGRMFENCNLSAFQDK